MGQSAGQWTGWRQKLLIRNVGGFVNVQRELKRISSTSLKVYGLIDRDWRSDDQVRALQEEYPTLLILPRVMIENYLVDPNEVVALLPSGKIQPHFRTLQATLTNALDDYLKHGALSLTLWERDAHHFCDENGYPRALLQGLQPELETRILLQNWHERLNPEKIMESFFKHHNLFTARPIEVQFRSCLNGKLFFNTVVISTLNELLGQRSRDEWLNQFKLHSETNSAVGCPPDLAAVLTPILT
jgi:hypothetical protein